MLVVHEEPQIKQHALMNILVCTAKVYGFLSWWCECPLVSRMYVVISTSSYVLSMYCKNNTLFYFS